MVKRLVHIVLMLALLLPVKAGAQSHIRRAMERAKEQREAAARASVRADGSAPVAGGYLPFIVENGDTTFLDRLDPIWIFASGKANDAKWREYYKLVWRFPRVYPYAVAAGKLLAEADSTITAEGYGRMKKDRYINELQKQLFKDFEKPMRQMSIQQGALMLKLIDRETGLSSYDIIKDYKNGAAAGFWQGIARLFDNSLKSRYDPEGEDREIEELVTMWKEGSFNKLYWSIFWEDAPVPTLPERYR